MIALDECMAIRLGGYNSAFSCSLQPGHNDLHNDQRSGVLWDDTEPDDSEPGAAFFHDFGCTHDPCICDGKSEDLRSENSP